MKQPALYLRISDKIISVSGEQKPLESTVRFTTTYENDLQAFNDSFIEVSNPEVIPTSESFKIKDGIFVAEGLEFEVKEEKYMTNPPRLTGHKVAVVSLSSTPDPVEPTAKAEKKYTLSEVLDIMAAYSICPSDYSVAETKKDFPHQFKGKREDAEKWIIKNF